MNLRDPHRRNQLRELLISPVELRGFEPLTPTLPGTGTCPEQKRLYQKRLVGGAVEGVGVVSVVVRIVVKHRGVSECFGQGLFKFE